MWQHLENVKNSLLELSDEDAPDFDGYLFDSVPIFQGEAGMTILPLYAAPQYAPQVTDWLWQAFGGETLPRQFFASIVQHSQTAEALPLTFIAVEGEQLLGTIGLWRCDLISRRGSVSPAGGAVRRARRPRSGAGRKTAAACDRLCPPRGLSGALSLLRLPGFL